MVVYTGFTVFVYRPFERTITMQKDSAGFIGFIFKDGKIKSLVKDSSAARNGVLTEHQLIEVNGQNVVGVKVGITVHLNFYVVGSLLNNDLSFSSIISFCACFIFHSQSLFI